MMRPATKKHHFPTIVKRQFSDFCEENPTGWCILSFCQLLFFCIQDHTFFHAGSSLTKYRFVVLIGKKIVWKNQNQNFLLKTHDSARLFLRMARTSQDLRAIPFRHITFFSVIILEIWCSRKCTGTHWKAPLPEIVLQKRRDLQAPG